MLRPDSPSLPTFELERAEMALGRWPVAGVDEAGRGPWAGPVVAAAVVLDPARIPGGIADSKQLDAAEREAAFEAIRASGAGIGIGIADVGRIDRMNILHATMWAMTAALGQLRQRPRLALIDGDRLPYLDCPGRAIVSGDATCVSIAAASIVAKVTRDRIMSEMAERLPGYGFERNKGYGTPQHRAAIARLGVSAEHRRSFRPVQLALELSNH